MALTKVIGNGLGTLGDGTDNDTKIVFDGNAQDYHIGLDDSSDKLVIGKGTALGTTTSMSFDENGIITKPLQPAFHIHKNGTNQDNIAINGENIVWSNGRFDNNSDFDLTENRFNAPVTGKYFLQIQVRFDYLDTAANYYQLSIITSNQTYYTILDPDYFDSDAIYYTMGFSVFADMDVSDTASIAIAQSGGTSQTDINGQAIYTWFAGYLVC